MKLVIKLGIPYKCGLDDDYFETDENWVEETQSLEAAKSRLKKEFRIYDVYQSKDKIVACVY